jgi:hypothetical protein
MQVLRCGKLRGEMTRLWGQKKKKQILRCAQDDKSRRGWILGGRAVGRFVAERQGFEPWIPCGIHAYADRNRNGDGIGNPGWKHNLQPGDHGRADLYGDAMMMRQSRYWDGWKILTVAGCTLPAVLAGCSAGLAPGNAWVADNALGSLFEFDRNQALVSTSGYTDNAMVAPVAIAFDASTHAWTVDNGNSGVSLFAAGGRSILTAPVTGGGLSMPSAVAVDGAGKVWVTNAATAGSLSELAYGQSAPVPSSGLGVLHTPMALAIDASGSIWTANAGDNSVSEFVGMATPVTTPLAANAGP